MAGPRSKAYARAAGITILALATLIAGIEIGSRVALVRVSRIESRIAQDFKDAEALRPGTNPNVLLLGNSRLLEGLNYEGVRKAASLDFHVTRYVIESTGYVDWYYGIRRLLGDGSRPDLIVLCLAPLDMVDRNIRGDYSAYYMFQAGDIPEISKTLNYSMTESSNLVFAHYSFFYASRNNVRNFVLNRAYPAYGEFLHGLQTTAGEWPSSEVIRSVAEQRLNALNVECSRYQIPFAFVSPPARRASGEAELLEAGRRTKTRVAVPIPGGVLKADMFRDNFHLNERGAQMFTRALEQQVRQWLPSQRDSSATSIRR